MIFFLIPAYNESLNLPDLINSISSKMINEEFQIIIVDDGSIDKTIEVVKNLNNNQKVILIENGKNYGPGFSFKNGFSYILGKASESDFVITMEADNTGDMNILKDIIKNLNEGIDIVLSSCYAPKGQIKGTNFFRILISWIANNIIALIFNLKDIYTYSSFYRGYRVLSLKKSWYAWNGNLITKYNFVCMVEMLIKMSMFDIQIKEIPAVLNCNLRKGRSKMKVIKTTYHYFQFFVEHLFLSSSIKKTIRKRFNELI